MHESGCPLDVDLQCGGCSPLILAARNAKLDIARWLLENGASTTKGSCTHRPHGGRETPLEILLWKKAANDSELVRLLMDKFVDDGGNIFQHNLVTTAASCGNTTSLNILLEYRKRFANHSRYEMRGNNWEMPPDFQQHDTIESFLI